jgi:hypothetical protein
LRRHQLGFVEQRLAGAHHERVDGAESKKDIITSLN